LINREGEIQERYDKLYLVPFGEYVPLKPIFGFLEPLAYSLGISNFQPGTEMTQFSLENGNLPFSALICFEDIFPQLARAFVRRGARFLAVMTNDAWFGVTAAPYQHLQASILRAVENGVPIVRSANTGVSAFISNKGEVLDTVTDTKGKKIFATGHKTYPLPLDFSETIYGKGGWLFPYVAVFLYAMIFFIQKGERRAK